MEMGDLVMLKRIIVGLMCALIFVSIFAVWMMYEFITLMRRREREAKEDEVRRKLARRAPDELAPRRARKQKGSR